MSDRSEKVHLSERQEVWRGLLMAQRSMFLRLTSALKAEYGLTPAHFEALLTLWECPQGRLSMSDLSRALLYSSGSATHLVQAMETRGWVLRATDAEDRRSVQVSLTEAGHAVIDAARARHLADLAAEFDPLVGAEELAVLLDFTRRFAAHEGVVSHP